MTSQPTNESELQLYRVIQGANLLSYYDTFIGGDDVQQLCEAGKEEFLEIMALVGMARKPLHVRYIQKALHEWVSNPTMFQTPLVPALPQSHRNHYMSGMGSRGGSMSRVQPLMPMRPSPPMSTMLANNAPSPAKDASTPAQIQRHLHQRQQQQQQQQQQHHQSHAAPPQSSQVSSQQQKQPHPPTHRQLQQMYSQSLPPYVMNMPENDPRRMDEIRKYAAIYGRFDCKRKAEKPMTMQEASVNEAAA